MTKLINVQAYPIENVPDHLTHECSQLGIEIAQEIEKLVKNKNPNIILGAFTFAHAAMIKNLISDDPEQLKKASELYAIGLIKNVQFLADLQKNEKT